MAQVVSGLAVTSMGGPEVMVAIAVNCWLPLTGIEGAAGVTAIDTTVAAYTVKVSGSEVIPPKLAVMADVPAATPRARPVCRPIEATAGVPVAQVVSGLAVTSMGGPEVMVAIAVNCWLPLTGIEGAAGVTAIDTTVAGFTVNVSGSEVTPPKLAVMADVPAATPTTRPVCRPIEATAGVPVAQVVAGLAVTSMGGPEVIVAIAINCWVPLIGMNGAVGVTAIDTTVAAYTVNVSGSEVTPPKVAVMADVPALTPVATPVFSATVAMPGVPEIQLESVVTSRVEPSLNVAVATNC